MEVNYVDYRDASGEIIEVGDGAGIRANTGSVSLDRTVYPVPWGTVADIVGGSTGSIGSAGVSVFPIHATGVSINTDDKGLADLPSVVDDATDTLGAGDITIHVRVNDPDFDISAAGEDKISIPDASVPPVKLTISRQAAAVTLGYAGGASTFAGVIDVVGADPDLDDAFLIHSNGLTVLPTGTDDDITLFGPINEIAPDAGIFESDITIRYVDGPTSPSCPVSVAGTLARIEGAVARSCILQGDILTVEYTDPTDASGDPNTVTDSATFDFRNGVLQSDKSV